MPPRWPSQAARGSATASCTARATVIARVLYADGVAPGDRVAIWSPNTHHWVLGALGTLCAGATLVPVNTRFTGPEALDVISRSGARVLIVAGPFLGTDRLAALRAQPPRRTHGAEAAAASAGCAASSRSPSRQARPVADGAIGWDEFTGRAAARPGGRGRAGR